eukprot:scaffold27639_cov42-Prasinocladus_malaysianus.AAC.1
MSSKYFFWDPDFAALSLGKISALYEIFWVQEMAKQAPSFHFYYLGYYIHDCPKMRYKADYHPSDLLCPVNYIWTPYDLSKDMLDRNGKSLCIFSEALLDSDSMLDVGDLISEKNLGDGGEDVLPQQAGCGRISVRGFSCGTTGRHGQQESVPSCHRGSSPLHDGAQVWWSDGAQRRHHKELLQGIFGADTRVVASSGQPCQAPRVCTPKVMVRRMMCPQLRGSNGDNCKSQIVCPGLFFPVYSIQASVC